MAEAERKLNNGKSRIDFQTDPSKYRHWKLAVNGEVATLLMDVDEKGTLFQGYELKLNSYDLGVDIELADAIERLRFEHPQVRVILLRSGKPRVFCAGANIRMLAGASHAHKVNFCKFTNETRNAIEDASLASGLATICVINGTAAGGGYELARAERLATITVRGPDAAPPQSADEMVALGSQFWPLRVARELDDAILDIRVNEFDTAAVVFKSAGDGTAVLAYDQFLDANMTHW